MHSILNNLDSNTTVIDQGYFDAWRGYYQQSSNGFILRRYVQEDENESPTSMISLRDYTEGTFDKNEFRIRRGAVLSVFGMNRKDIAAKLEEYEKCVRLFSSISHSFENYLVLQQKITANVAQQKIMIKHLAFPIVHVTVLKDTLDLLVW